MTGAALFDGFEEYQVANLGRVRRVESEGIVTINCSEHYPRVLLTKTKNRSKRYVHSRVATAFHGARPPGMETRHFPDQTTAIRDSDLLGLYDMLCEDCRRHLGIANPRDINGDR